MSQSMLVVLRFLHIVSGAIWFGAVIVMTFYVMPSIGAAGPAGGAVMKQVGERKYPVFVMIMMLFTVLSGLGMMWYFSSTSGSVWFQSRMGRTISLGATVAILAAVAGMAVGRPTMMRMAKIAADIGGGTPTAEQAAEMKALQARGGMVMRAVAWAMVVAVGAMAVARYL